MSLMNGLSQMGAGIAAYAGAQGLELQKATLAQQGMVLADQLAHTSKTAEIAQTGSIAAGAASALQTSQLAQLAVTTASAQKVAGMEGASRVAAAQAEAGGMMGAAGISAATSRANTAAVIAANAPVVKQQAAEAAAQAGLAGDNLTLANKSLDISLQIAAETAKPPEQQDPGKLSQLMNQRLQFGMTPDVLAKVIGSLDGMIRATQQEATEADAAVARVIGQEASLNMGDASVRATQKAEEAQVTAQRDAAYQRLNTMTGLAQSYLPHAAGAPNPPGGGKPLDLNQFLKQAPGSAPAPPAAGPASGPRPGVLNAPAASLPPYPMR